MSKFVGFIVGAALIAVGVLTDNPALIIQGAAMIVTQAIVDLTAPKQPARQASEMTIALGEQPRVMLLGETFTPGSLVDGFDYGGKYGTDWEVLIIRLADEPCESLTGFYVNDEYVPYTGDGNYPQFDSHHFSLWFRSNTSTVALPSVVTDHGPGWTSSDIGASGCDVIVAYLADAPDAKKPAWPGGRPHFGFVVKGGKRYDPRLDSTVTGGSGSHRIDDPTTWEWTENAVINWYGFERGVYVDGDTTDQTKLLVGRGLSAEESPPENIFAAANLCDDIAAAVFPYLVIGRDGDGQHRHHFGRHLEARGGHFRAQLDAVEQPQGIDRRLGGFNRHRLYARLVFRQFRRRQFCGRRSSSRGEATPAGSDSMTSAGQRSIWCRPRAAAPPRRSTMATGNISFARGATFT
jgi:hypothetical protein